MARNLYKTLSQKSFTQSENKMTYNQKCRVGSFNIPRSTNDKHAKLHFQSFGREETFEHTDEFGCQNRIQC